MDSILTGDYVQHRKTQRVYWVRVRIGSRVKCEPDDTKGKPRRAVWIKRENLEKV